MLIANSVCPETVISGQTLFNDIKESARNCVVGQAHVCNTLTCKGELFIVNF